MSGERRHCDVLCEFAAQLRSKAMERQFAERKALQRGRNMHCAHVRRLGSVSDAQILEAVARDLRDQATNPRAPERLAKRVWKRDVRLAARAGGKSWNVYAIERAS